MSPSLATTFARWGTPPTPVEVSPAAKEFLLTTLGEPHPRPSVPLADVHMPPGRLNGEQRESLIKIVGAGGLSNTDSDRLGHAVGCSLTDYLKLRSGDPANPPDAVVRPASHDEVREVLSYCSNNRIAVIPFGGGTSVVGGVSRDEGHSLAVSLTFDRMADVLSVDEVSMTATVQPGITGPVLERILGTRGLTWGHLPQSWERASIGGYIATRSAGQASSGYGRSDEMVEALRVATPMGELALGRGPKSAAGPDLKQLFIGSEGALGVITEITLRIRHIAKLSKYEGLMFPDYASGVAAFRELAQSRLTADVMRLSDVDETAATLAMSGPKGRAGDLFARYLDLRKVAGGCMAILGWESQSRISLVGRRRAAWAVLRRHGAATLGSSVGDAWKRHRYDGPYLRDELIDRGFVVETLETAGHWAQLADLRAAVQAALIAALETPRGHPYVMSHVSHVYETGGSLYFTVLVPAQEDPISQWRRAKGAATDAIMANGGTVTHHHAIGRDHAPWLEQEIGLEGIRILRSVKAAVDPQGVMNPGALLSI
jgi:alkyldihydroxyacetonephosphate synthase